MSEQYPPDEDGDALRRLAAGGNDMARPMEIDFSIAVPDEPAAQRVAEAAVGRGFRVEVYFDEEDGSWSVYCTRRMLATHAGVVAVQQELEALCAPLGGTCDGWGTFGNAEAP
jgi:regulator of RNase E activity RraB